MAELISTIAVILPHEVQAYVMPLLRRFMPELVGGYYGHITVLAPFAPFQVLDEACEKLRDVLLEVNSFPVTLAGYGAFPLAAFMPVVNPEPLCAVHDRITQAFPQYPPYNGAFGNEYKPHVTIAHLQGQSGGLPAGLPDYTPFSFTVNRIHVQYGIPGTALPWIAYDVIQLKGH